MDAENLPKVEIKEEEEVMDSEEEIIVVSPKTPKAPFTASNSSNAWGFLRPTRSSSTNNSQSVPKKRKKLTLFEREEKRRRLDGEKLKKEQEKRKREEELEVKRRDKEEAQLKREEEKRQKKEETERKNKEKETEKILKEAERLKKAEERDRIKREKELKKEEKEFKKRQEEDKKEREAKRFASFFTKKTPSAGNKGQTNNHFYDADTVSLDGHGTKSHNHISFNPVMFQVKRDMALAPIFRRPKMTLANIQYLDRFVFCSTTTTKTNTLTNKQAMEIDVKEEDNTGKTNDDDLGHNNYLTELKTKNMKRGRCCGRTEMPDRDIQLISTKFVENPSAQGLIKWRYKLLQFHDNQRPAYWGTWKKKSEVAKPRKPWGHEKEIDYEFDSDDEWEEEEVEDAEDLAGSDEEDDPTYMCKVADEEKDDDWMVPHGYTSDDEGTKDEHLDKAALKLEEKYYFEGLNKKIRFQVPEIKTERLSDLKMIFCPMMKDLKMDMSAVYDEDSITLT